MNARLAGSLAALLGLVFFAAPGKAAPPAVQQELIHAVVQDDALRVDAMLARGGDPNARFVPGEKDAWYTEARPADDHAPPLILLACRFGSIHGPTIIDRLIRAGANVNIADRNGVTPLMAASELGSAVSLLLEHGANPNARDSQGKTPLMYAMNNRGLGVVTALLAKGAAINARDAAGDTALHYAVRGARWDPIRIFGDDLQRKRVEQEARYRELIGFLIHSGADVNVKDSAGLTPLAVAEQFHGQPIIDLLRSAGARR